MELRKMVIFLGKLWRLIFMVVMILFMSICFCCWCIRWGFLMFLFCLIFLFFLVVFMVVFCCGVNEGLGIRVIIFVNINMFLKNYKCVWGNFIVLMVLCIKLLKEIENINLVVRFCKMLSFLRLGVGCRIIISFFRVVLSLFIIVSSSVIYIWDLDEIILLFDIFIDMFLYFLCLI